MATRSCCRNGHWRQQIPLSTRSECVGGRAAYTAQSQTGDESYRSPCYSRPLAAAQVTRSVLSAFVLARQQRRHGLCGRCPSTLRTLPFGIYLSRKHTDAVVSRVCMRDWAPRCCSARVCTVPFFLSRPHAETDHILLLPRTKMHACPGRDTTRSQRCALRYMLTAAGPDYQVARAGKPIDVQQ